MGKIFMKILFRNWRKYLAENKTQKLGVYVKDSSSSVSLALVDLTRLKNELEQSANLQDFAEKLQSDTFFKNSLVGYINAGANKYLAKGPPTMGGSGGTCYDTWSVKKSIGRGYGRQLYDALLGWAAEKNIYLTADRTSVTGAGTKKGAAGVWDKVDQQTNDEVPPKQSPYMGKFDSWEKKTTNPTDDDCNVYGVDSLDKGYRDDKKIMHFKQLESNLKNFFTSDIEPLFSDSSFFDKLFGRTPAKEAEKLKNKFLSIGEDNFLKFMLGDENK